ncbi:pyridoxamine 5'-phosphate oxidase-domain-containing protein [Gloeopeniophorella convolvens]|nr:pyridoxamine 5'-phosphate oxidase-domain-containing protein [Gloeopeniophorella convolvens]
MLRFIYLVSLAYLAALARAYETLEEAAALARGLLAQPPAIGTMATLYPSDHPTLPGAPYAMQEYFAPCFANGSLALVLLPISRHGQNVLRAPAGDASLTVSTAPADASRARVALLGNVVLLDEGEVEEVGEALRACYTAWHPDARAWMPGDKRGAHLAYWARFDPHTVYFVGGFGDEHFIGYIPLDVYQVAKGSQLPEPESPARVKLVQQDAYL